MNQDALSTKAMWGDTPGEMKDLFKTEYTYRNKRGETLKAHPKGKGCIRGFVPDEFAPAEGSTFKMFHHQVAGIQKFGQIQLEGCKNIIVEDDLLYFENASGTGKYILTSCRPN